MSAQRVKLTLDVNPALNNPPNLKEWRDKLHDIDEELYMSLDDFKTYWPYVSNFWVLQKSNNRVDGSSKTYYMCRLAQKIWKPKKIPGINSRTRSIRDGKQDGVGFRQ
jgi:2,5-diamino-6-(ribosylamino)-4(3H)-pyrimidinone 5'-phosphate reductase